MKHTFKVYLVGGAVRDHLLGRPIVEKDWVVVGAQPQDMLDLGYTQVGKDFPVFLHPKTKDEYALARTERKQGQGYTGFVCDTSKHVTLEDDLFRRDLTVNAMAQDESGRIIDPYHGQQDLTAKVLRHVSEAFCEDPLRVLRVARFAARYDYLGFAVAHETMGLMKTMATTKELCTLSQERVWKETEKALNERSPYVFFHVLRQCGAVSECFSGLDELADIPALSETMAKLASLNSNKSALTYQDKANAQCALICLGLSLFSNSDPLKWLKRTKAPKAAIQLCDTCIRTASYFQVNTANPKIDEKTIMALFNDVDVWRKEDLFLRALDIITTTDWLSFVPSSDQIKAMLIAMLNEAKQITAKSVMSDTVKGPLIKEAMNNKRQARICEALKLW